LKGVLDKTFEQLSKEYAKTGDYLSLSRWILLKPSPYARRRKA
jgi:hypothetical protein